MRNGLEKRKWIICPACKGEGRCVNPNIDSNGLTRDDFAEDPDFAEDYLSGAYDVTCAACGGAGKIEKGHLKVLAEHAADRRLAAMEAGNYAELGGLSDYRYG